ncbi:MAG: alpha/beta fold hydrolase, partial [Acidimicrobiia bacterium]|nr:alpha/beta fold hydrolase [Acidimicrobiia bacterium]
MAEFRATSGSLFYDVRGSGDRALVLLHGYTGSSHDFFHHVDSLANGRRVISLDLAGHGNSGHRPGYSVAALNREVIEFLDTLDGQVDLLGHSMGGRIALEVVTARPDLVSSLILMCTTYDDFGLNRSDAELTARLEFARLGVDRRSGDEPAQLLFLESVDSSWMKTHDQMKAKLDPTARRQLGIEIFGGNLPSLYPALTDVGVATTIIAGSLDLPYLEPSGVMARVIPGAKLAWIDGAYHVPQLTHRSV